MTSDLEQFIKRHHSIFYPVPVSKNDFTDRYNKKIAEGYYKRGLHILSLIEQKLQYATNQKEYSAMTLAYLLCNRKDKSIELNQKIEDIIPLSPVYHLLIGEEKKGERIIKDIEARITEGLVYLDFQNQNIDTHSNIGLTLAYLLNNRKEDAIKLLKNIETKIGFFNGLIKVSKFLNSSATRDNALLVAVYHFLNRRRDAVDLIIDVETKIGFDEYDLVYQDTIETRIISLEANALLAFAYFVLAGKIGLKDGRYAIL